MSRYNGNMGLAFDLSLGRQPAMTSSEQTARQIMCSAAAGAAGNSTSDRFTNSNIAARRDAAAAEPDHVHALNNTIITSDVGDLETYVRALQCEREKLDAFRRELPICMGLLDDAIEASSVKLMKTVEGSIASRVSYMSTRATMNTSSSPYSNSNLQSINKHLGVEDSSVPNTPGRPTSLTGSEHVILNSLWPSNINQHAINSGTSSSNWISKLPAGNMQISSPTSNIHGAGAVQLQLMNENFQIAAAPAVTPRWSRAPEHQQLVKQQTLIAAPIKKEGIYSLRDDTIRSNMRGDEHVDSCFMSTEELQEIRYKDRARTTEFIRNNMTTAGSPHNINDMQAQCTSTGHIIGGSSNGNQPPRKVRRCWSPELHQLFLHALHQLGGPQLATPKQIREVMHVDGLTNDEVKSHLQKYRLHTRRPSLLQTCEPAAEQPHHLLLFGGIWVPTGAAGASAESASKSADEVAAAAGAPSQSSNATFNMHRFQSQVYTSTNSPTVMSGTSSDQLDTQAGVEVASEVDVARSSDQSTSLNGEGGGGATMGPHSFEEEDTQIHLGSKLL